MCKAEGFHNRQFVQGSSPKDTLLSLDAKVESKQGRFIKLSLAHVEVRHVSLVTRYSWVLQRQLADNRRLV